MYECHITLSPKDATEAATLAKLHGFKTSEIARDEVMGDQNWFYCTRSHPDFQTIRGAMYGLVEALEARGIYVHRTKIEHIVWDWRPNKPVLDLTGSL